MYLESIFASSEDIRKQLPQEAITFDDANDNWRRNMEFMFVTRKILTCLDVLEVKSTKI